MFLDIERGKTLVVRNQAVGEPDDKGMCTVFFEMNGQPRRVKVPDRSTCRQWRWHKTQGGAWK